MPDGASLGVFLAAALAVVLIPGPAVLYIVARSVDAGRRAGLLSVLGVGVGNLVQVLLAALGLAALVASSAVAYDAIRIAGALYLFWLGVARLRSRGPAALVLAPHVPGWRTFRQGALVATLNPKTALFFVAFLPQFADPAQTVWLQIGCLGAVFVVLALATDSLYAVASGSIADRLRRTSGSHLESASRYAAAGVYFALGALALAGGRRTS